ncbi:MAG TPA: tetratricopeptide repeat protein [Spirochaetes bacterium]|nr:tetratricopeptide repeat protein [Spirochaetota bacterium]
MNSKVLALFVLFLSIFCISYGQEPIDENGQRSFTETVQGRGENPGLEAVDIYNKANQHYASNDFQSALSNYLVVIERGVKNPQLYYNLGNTYFKLGEPGYAILYYEKALALRSFDRETRENLEYAKRSLKERVLPLYNENFFKILREIYSYLNLRNIAFIELFVFTVLIALSYLYLFSPYKRHILKKYFVLCAVVFIIFSTASFFYQSNEKKHPKGIVVEKEIEVMTAPIAESGVLFVLHEGTATKLLETREEWLLISLTDGREGWVYTQGIVFR